MKNMNYYKGKHAASEANSPYNKNKNGGKFKEGFMHAIGKSMAEALTETITGGMFDKAISRFGGKTNAADLKNQMKYKGAADEITEELVNIPVQNFRKDLTEGKIYTDSPTIHLKDKKDYVPQTKSRKDPSTDVTPQSQKGKKFLKSKITKLIKKKK